MSKLSELAGTKWTGRGELWLDGLGDEASRCDCAIEIGDGALTYRWSLTPWGEEGRAVRMTCRRDG